MFNEEDRQWLYDQFKSNGYDTGSYDEFVNSLNNDEDFKWWHEQATGLGLEVGDINEFGSLFRNTPAAEAKPARPTRAERENARKEENARLDKEIQGTVDQFGKIRAGQTPESSSIEDIPQKAAAYMESNPVEGKSPRDLAVEELAETRKANDEFVKEYDRRFAEYNNDLDNDLSGPDQDAKKRWLDENNAKYREAKEAASRLEGMLNLATKEEDIQRIEEKKRDVNANMDPAQTIALGYTPFGGSNAGKALKEEAAENADYEAARDIYNMAEQTINQGSKYDSGYEGNALEQVWTAATQFVEGGLNNIDKGSLTFGLSEGASLTRARKAGDKSNEIVDKTLKDMKVSDKQVDDLLKSVDEDAKKLNALSEELTAEAAELEAMGTTIEDMKRSGESDAKINEYIKKYNSKLKAYNAKVKDEYDPLKASYDKSAQQYETIMSAVDAALESGLTDGEKALLDALEEYTDAKIKRANDVSVASAAGAGAEQSAEFMLDFILTGGFEKVGTKAALKLTERRIMKKFGKEAAMQVAKPSFGAKVLTDMGVAAARTTAMFPRNLAAYGEQLTQMTGKDQYGRYNFDRSHLNAAFNTALTQYIEYWSEGFGEYFGAAEQAAFKRVARRAPHSMIGQTLGKYRGTIGSYLDQGKFNGMFNEMLEEVVGSTFNALAGWMSNDRVGDKEAMKDFFSGEQLATLALSFLPMSAMSAGTNIRAYNKMKERYDNSVTKLNPFIRSGEIEQKDLEALTTNIEGKTPEQITSEIAAIADKAREKNGGRLPEDFTQNLLGYVEGAYSMSLNAEAWEGLEPVVSAYTEQYANPLGGNAYDLNQAEQRARAEAASEGWSDSDLDKDAEVLAKIANEVDDPVLAQYAQAKAASAGRKDGIYARNDAEVDTGVQMIWEKADNNGEVLLAGLPGHGTVLITSKDATVDANGRLTTPTGPDGLVTWIEYDGYGNGQAKASDFAARAGGVFYKPTETHIRGIEEMHQRWCDERYEAELNTISPTAKVAAVSELVGNTILVEDGNGNVSSVNIINFNPQTGKATIKDEKGNQREVFAEDLYDSAQKNPSGDIELDPNAKENEQALTPASTQSADGLDDLIGSTVTISLNGKPVSVEVGAVNDAEVEFYYKDANGNEKGGTMSREQFAQAMQSANAPVAETPEEPEAPVAEEPAEQPASTLPLTKDGELDWDNMFNVPAEEFAKRIPELVEVMNETLGENAIKEVMKSYNAAGEEVKKAQERADKNTNLGKAPELYKALAEAKMVRANYSALINALRPNMGGKAAGATTQAEGEAPVESAPSSTKSSEKRREAAQKAIAAAQAGRPKMIARWENRDQVVGNNDSIVDADGNEHAGHWELVNVGSISPSHDPFNGYKVTEGVTLDENGKTLNDRDYEHDKAAQKIVEDIASDFDARAWNDPIIVNPETGEVYSGNNRAMSRMIAAKNSTDKKYVDFGKKHLSQKGLAEDAMENVSEPTLVFVLDEPLPMTTETFALFNKESKKGQSQLEEAVKLGKTLSPEAIRKIADIVNGYEDINEVYRSEEAVNAIIQTLVDDGAISELQLPALKNGSELSGRGQDLVESALAGAVLEEEALRIALDDPSIRKPIAAAVAQILVNQTLGEYSLKNELTDAVILLEKAKRDGLKIDESIQSYVRQLDLFAGEDKVYDAGVQMLAEALNKKKYTSLKKILSLYNNEAKDILEGVMPMFDGTEKEDILNRILVNVLGYENGYQTLSAEEAESAGQGGAAEESGADSEGEQSDTAVQGDDAGAGRVESAETTGRAIKPGDRLSDGTVFEENDILLRDLASRIGDDVIESLEGAGFETAKQVLKADLGSVALDTDLDMDRLAEVYDILRRELENKANGAQGTAEETTPEPIPETPAEEEGEQLLTEEEIRNSGYPDQDVIDSAVDYINGERGFAESLAYNEIVEYVRTHNSTTQRPGESASETQLDGQPVQTEGVAAESGRGETEPVDTEGNREESTGGVGAKNGPVLPGERGTETTGETGPAAGENADRGGESGRRSGTDESGLQLADESTGQEGNAVDSGESNQRGAEAGSTDIDALAGELEGLLDQFSNLSPSVSRDYSAAPENLEKRDTARLSQKQPKKPTVTLSLDGMSPKQQALAAKIIFTAAKLGYANAKTEGLTTYNDFHRWFTQKFGEAVMAGLNYDQSSLDAFIDAAWKTKMNIDGERHTLGEFASEIHDKEIQETKDKSAEERLAAQEAANKKGVAVVRGSRKNIAASVPVLTPGQWDDVVAIERQFFDPSHNDYDHCYGKGMLVSNGTGTGKTFTGLGTIKRFIDEGKGRILVVAPASMKHEWAQKAKLLGIKMHELEDTKDKGEGVVVTSYENFRMNAALLEDTFDLVVYDECQNIIENQKGGETLAFTAHRMIGNRDVDEALERLASSRTQEGQRRTALRNKERALRTERKNPKRKPGQSRDERREEIDLEIRDIELQINNLTSEINALKPQFMEDAQDAVKRTKVLFLSATPFNTIANLRYAAGFIFNYPRIYNSNQEEVTDENQKEQAFWTEWFRGETPMEQQEVEFGDHLLDELETAYYRVLENGYDYSREFPDVSGMVMATRFNAAMAALHGNPKYKPLLDAAASFIDNPQWTSLLYETMKVSAMRDRIVEHINAGRKVVIFHDRLHVNRGGAGLPPVGPPLQAVLDAALNGNNPNGAPVGAIMEFRHEFADVLKWEAGLDYRPVHEQVIDFFATPEDRAKYEAKRQGNEKKIADWEKEVRKFIDEHPEMDDEELEKNMPKRPKGVSLEAESVAVYNGECTDKEKEAAKAEFNNDESKKKIICVTTRSGGAGLSLHDTTGKHQRVLIQTALPISPIGFIQAEGRIFRWGNKSNAVFEYPRLGIDHEVEVFAKTFNAKAETVENIAHGFRGRGLKDSIMTGFYENSGNVPIDGEGLGGVERDRRGSQLKDMAKAKHDYGVAKRKGIKPEDKSIPEPVGYAMTKWSQATSGDTALVPFAGRGSIARYVPTGITLNVLEDEASLMSDLQCTAGRPDLKVRDGLFGELNTINKADVILLSGNHDGMTVNASGSLNKAFSHLDEGGRIVAVVPDNGGTDLVLAKINSNGGLLRMTIKVGPGTLEGNTEPMRIVIIDKVTREELRKTAPATTTVDLSGKSQEELFDSIDVLKVPARIIDEKAIKFKKTKAVATELKKNKLVEYVEVRDNRYGGDVHIRMTARFGKGMTNSRYRLDSCEQGVGWVGKGIYIDFPNVSRLDADSDFIVRYKWIKEALTLTDAEFRRRANCREASQEDVESLKDLYRSYVKLIRAMTGLSESQIMRISQGMRPDISASDIETLNGYQDLREKFEAANHDDAERQELYDKVAPVAEKIGLAIGVYSGDRGFGGFYDNKSNSLKINRVTWQGMEDTDRATTLLHEFIHSVTVYALEGQANDVPGMGDGLYKAAQLANDVYRQITKGAPEDVAPLRGYSLENEREMMAEMANPKIRDRYKQRKMWVIRNGDNVKVYGFKVDGAQETTAWALLDEALDGILKNFDKGLFDRYVGRSNEFMWDLSAPYVRVADMVVAPHEAGEQRYFTADGTVYYPSEYVDDSDEANAEGLRFREEDDPEVIEQLESGEKINVYRAMQLIDGKLYPPMSAKVNGQMREPVSLGKWEKAEENPDLADDNGNFVLNKGNGASLKAKYNPYIHTSRTPLNDQFTSAYNRPNLVTVEVQVPASELTSGYKAEKAKDTVGEMTWHSGPVSGKLPEGKKRKVILSRWDKPIRVLTDSEVAQRIAELLDGENISIPYNVVTPGLRAELEKLGVQISDTPSGKVSEIRTRESGTTELAAKEARVSALELRATEKVLDSMSEQLGIKINKVSRREMPVGHKTSKGYYNTKTGEMTICMDNVTDERDAIATVLHETVGHHGLRKLFGARFNEVMTRIFSMLDRDGRKWVLNYMNRHDLKPGNAEDIIVGVEEYLSHLAERDDYRDTVWDKIKAFFGKVIDSLFGTQGFFLTDNELRYILRASYENLIHPNWADTVEGKAMDTLFKRELGINESDRNKPTDPEAESADIRWRDGDTGVANLDYDADMKDVGVLARMEVQDADLPVRKAMDRIMKEVGKESIAENEDFVTRHNQASSRAESQAHEFKTFCFDPLIGQIRGLIDRMVGRRASQSERDEAYQKVKRYIYAVSGLERNAYKNNEIEAQKQDALTAARQAAAQKKQGKTAVEQRAIDRLLAQQEKEIEQRYEDMKRDWSGLTSLMEEGDWRKAENKARTMVASFSKEIGDAKALDALWDAIRACTDYSLDHALKHGLLTREEYNKLHGTATEPRMWEHYVPLRGFAAGTAEDSYSYETLTRPATNSVVTKKMKGRVTEADDPIANIFHIALTEIVQGNENWAKQALYRFVLDAGQNSLLSVREPWFVKNERTGTWSMAEPYSDETYEEFEERMEEKREKGEAKKGRQSLKLDKIVANKGHRNEHLIKLKIGGVEKAIWVNGNPAVAQAVAGMDRANNMKLIRRASRALSNLFTTYSLDFTARNLMRDTIYSRLALIMKEDNAYRHQFKKNWWKNFGYGAFAFPMVKMMAEWESGKLQKKANPTKRERQFIEFMRDGGQTGYTIVEGLDKIKRDMERAMRSAKPGKTVTIPVLGHIADKIRVLNEGFELLTRFTAYQTSRDMGRSGQRSASDAKEISVNFNRRGAQTGKGFLGGVAAYFGATHYFFNAGVQGFENFLHLFKVAPGKMSASVAGFAAFGMLVPILNSALAGLAAGLGGDDDDRVDPDWYWNLPEWVRRNNMVFGTGRGYLAIPLPVELRAIYGIGDIAASIMYRKAPKNGFDIALDVMSTAGEILPVNPIEGYNAGGNLADVFIRPIVPDATMFFVDWATNRDYTGRPLAKENPFNKTTPRSQSAYASTPKALVDACQWLYSKGGPDLAPGVIRDFLKNYGGGIYKLAEDITKEIVADEQRPRRWDDIPFLSGFTGHIDEDRKNSFAFNTYYKYGELSEKVVKDLNGAAMTDGISAKMAYKEPKKMPKGARTQIILEGEDYILGKMFYEANKNTYQKARRKRAYKDKDGVYHPVGELYETKKLEKKGIERLKQEWQDLNEEWLAMPNGTQQEKDARKAFEETVTEARQLYYNAVCDLVDRMMAEEYDHVQRKMANGIPYEPKPSISERAFEMVKDIFE